jgi:hypothetical protein
MKHPIRIDVAELDKTAFDLERSQAPAGLSVSELKNEFINVGDGQTWLIYFLITCELLRSAALEVGKHLTADLAKDWLKDFLSKIRAKGVRVNGREPKDPVDLERIITEEIEIGKND